MFRFLMSADGKMRANAANWLEMGEKVWHYRRDQLSRDDAAELHGRIEAVRAGVRNRIDAARLKLELESLEEVLRRTGGRIYPKTALVENVEFFLVAAIVILGVRAYFIQPFKIPTNSMWPSYYGMTARVYEPGEAPPSPPMKALRFAALGSVHYEVPAPADGIVTADFLVSQDFLDTPGRGVDLAYRAKRGKKWFILPANVHEYTFRVNGQPVSVEVPADFRFTEVFTEAFFDNREEMSRHIEDAMRSGNAESVILPADAGSGVFRAYRIPLGRTVRKGEAIVAFDILTGDQLFVDRVSYHFVRPKVGQGFVFRTDNIDSRYMRTATGGQLEQYYIKRLAGVPGDELEIRGSTLLRNGAPIAGSTAFTSNAARTDSYPGYQNFGLLDFGERYKVAEDTYIALGDNSPNSQDSRYWGPVPEKDVVGRPMFVYYPFTSRWGPAR